MAYAANTDVSVEKSRVEIERLVNKHKCSKFMVGVDHEHHSAVVQFTAQARIVRFQLTLPDPTDRKFRTGRGQLASQRAFEQAERSKWRALLLVIKAKLEAVESHIATFEEEFMAHIVMPNDMTVGAIVTPLISAAYSNGQMPRGLIALPAGRGEVEGEVVGEG